MSASSKKKLRAAENAEKLTEKQKAEQKEAKKLKVFTIVMVVIVVAMLIFAIGTAVYNRVIVPKQAEKEAETVRNTIAMTIGEHEISNAEMNYFFMDSVNNFYSNYGAYASMFGLDLTKPLDEQYVDEEAGTTWADDFLHSAMENAKAIYALADEAEAQGYTLTEEDQAQVDNNMSYMEMYAASYGYSTEDYLKAVYGNGTTEESLRDYFELTILASSFASNYDASLTYTDADLRAAEAKNYNQYSAYSYNYYNISTSKFLEGGTTDEEGNTTYSDDEKAAAAAAAEAVAAELAGGVYASTEEFDAAIAALSINAENDSAASYAYADNPYSSINSLYRDWMTDASRAAGDVEYFENTSTSTDEEGNETTTISGYYVVYYVGNNDNTFALANVRHILIPFAGGTYDSTTGTTTYSDDEKAAALAEAEDLLASWKAGNATEDTFAALANENSADSDGTDGGLYTDIYPGQMVTNFNDWCFDESRQPGDTGIVESEYGYHVMYYSGDSETNYRDYMITEELRSADYTEWYNALVEASSYTEGNTQYVNTGLVLSQG